MIGVQAREDVTSTYLKDADLSSMTGWGDPGKTAWKTDGAVNVVEFWNWSTQFNFSQTATLPAGYYRLAVNSFYRNSWGGDGTNNDMAWIFAGEKKQNVVALTSMSELSGYAGSNDLYRAATAFSQGKYSNEFDFTVTGDGTTDVEIGFKGTCPNGGWCILGPVKLYQYTADDYIDDYDAKYTTANGLLSSPMNADVKNALQTAMVDRATLTTATVDEVKAAISTLNTAISNANTSISYYSSLKGAIDDYNEKAANLDSYGEEAASVQSTSAKTAYTNRTATDGVAEKTALDAAFKAGVLATKQPKNGLDMTPYITNPDFNTGNYDGWTTVAPKGGNVAIQGGSRMEYWAGDVDARKERTFKYYQKLSNLPAGVYTISADMFNSMNGEEGDFSATCGVYGQSGKEKVALVTEAGEVLKTYTTDEIPVFYGKMEVGVKNTITPMVARWFVFDNVKLTYVRQLNQSDYDDYTPPTSVSLSDAEVKIDGETTLTPTVLPAEADDKSVTWTSSDETVATVSDRGVVTAIGVGSVTITATANGAESIVSGSATITVNDVVPVTAPAYYSEIAAGDFYIMNAATGKYLGGANAWGTQASLIEHGIPFTVAVISEGKYTLDSHTYNSATDHFLNGSYVDQPSTNLSIVSAGDGKYTIATSDESGYCSANENSTLVQPRAVNPNSVLAQWYFISKSDRDRLLAAATEENPVDATYYIKEADISRNLAANGRDKHAWANLSTDGTQNNSNFAGQVYNAAVNVSQTINNIPNGTYVLTMQGFSSGKDVKLHANDKSVAISANTTGATTPSAASEHFANKECTNTVNVTVTDNTLTIRLDGDCSDNKWLCYDYFELYCKGLADIPVEFGASGFATFASDYPVALPDDESIKGYTASVSDATINFKKLTDKLVPANTGVMLSGTANTTMYLPVVAEAEAQSSAFIRGTGAAPGADDDYYFFAIKKSAAELTFGTFNPATLVVAKNKAYLKIAKDAFGSDAARLTLRFDDTTGINAVEAAESENGLKDGKYLIDGKIVLVKNGIKYSANGQKLN